MANHDRRRRHRSLSRDRESRFDLQVPFVRRARRRPAFHRPHDRRSAPSRPESAAELVVDQGLSGGGITTMDAIVGRTRDPGDSTCWCSAVRRASRFGLAGVGLFALVASEVTQRTREIGLRIALGAARGHVVRLMVSQGAGPAAVGLLAGAAASRALSRAVQPLLFDVSASDSATFAAVVLFFGLVIMTASYLPARRAGRIDPQSALRHE